MAQNRFILSKNKNAYKSWHLVTWHKHMKFTWTIMLIISYLIIAYLKYLQIVLQETYCRYNYLLQKKSQHGCVRWALREHLTPPCYDLAWGGLEDSHHTNDMVGQVSFLSNKYINNIVHARRKTRGEPGCWQGWVVKWQSGHQLQSFQGHWKWDVLIIKLKQSVWNR